MYDLISQIIDHSWITQGANEQQYIYYTCCCLIIIFCVVFIDLIYRIFSHFWSGRK